MFQVVKEVANAQMESYPARTLNGIFCGIRRNLVESVGSEALNPLQPEDKSRQSTYDFINFIRLSTKSTFIMLFLNNLCYFYCRFAIFRRCLDAEMKDSTRKGVSLQTKKNDIVLNSGK